MKLSWLQTIAFIFDADIFLNLKLNFTYISYISYPRWYSRQEVSRSGLQNKQPWVTHQYLKNRLYSSMYCQAPQMLPGLSATTRSSVTSIPLLSNSCLVWQVVLCSLQRFLFYRCGPFPSELHRPVLGHKSTSFWRKLEWPSEHWMVHYGPCCSWVVYIQVLCNYFS